MNEDAVLLEWIPVDAMREREAYPQIDPNDERFSMPVLLRFKLDGKNPYYEVGKLLYSDWTFYDDYGNTLSCDWLTHWGYINEPQTEQS